jgi:hypothetical protein
MTYAGPKSNTPTDWPASARRKDVKYQGQSFIQQTTLAARSKNLVGLFAERT